MRALVVSNMLPDDSHPERGSFVRDQVAALARLPDVEVQLFEFAPGARSLARAARRLWRERRGGRAASAGRARDTTSRPQEPLDVVHAHFGLTAWPAFAVPARVRALTVHGTDVRHPRTRLITAAALPRIDLLAAASGELVASLPGARSRRRARVLPCGVDTERFRPLPRPQARARLGLDADGPLLLFPADPARAVKRFDLARELARACGAPLIVLDGVPPERVPLFVNAASAVVVPSDAEGFGLAVLEALACDVPVLATPVGVHAEALLGVDGTLCAPFELERWRAAATPHLHAAEPRVAGRDAAERFSAVSAARKVREAWLELLMRSDGASG